MAKVQFSRRVIGDDKLVITDKIGNVEYIFVYSQIMDPKKAALIGLAQQISDRLAGLKSPEAKVEYLRELEGLSQIEVAALPSPRGLVEAKKKETLKALVESAKEGDMEAIEELARLLGQ